MKIQTKKRIASVIARTIIILILLLIIGASLAPLSRGISHIGMWLPVGIAAVGILVAVFYPLFRRLILWLWKRRPGKILLSFCGVTAGGTVLWVTGLSIAMAIAASAPTPGAGTVVILGAKVDPGGSPSPVLSRRLDAGIAYMKEHPGAPCIVTGGQGPDEPMSEAQAMKEYMQRRGIAAERIYMEDQATNTDENMRYSARIIEREGFSTDIVLVTDSFHQLRGQFFAEKAGLKAAPLNCFTEEYMFLGYWVRETMGLTRALVLGY